MPWYLRMISIILGNHVTTNVTKTTTNIFTTWRQKQIFRETRKHSSEMHTFLGPMERGVCPSPCSQTALGEDPQVQTPGCRPSWSCDLWCMLGSQSHWMLVMWRVMHAGKPTSLDAGHVTCDACWETNPTGCWSCDLWCMLGSQPHWMLVMWPVMHAGKPNPLWAKWHTHVNHYLTANEVKLSLSTHLPWKTFIYFRSICSLPFHH